MERMGTLDSIIVIAVVALITLLLRAAPFLLFSGKKSAPKLITYLGSVLPFAIIAALVVYCLRSTDLTAAPYGIPGLVSVVVVALLHLWKKNTLISILGGTTLYMILIRIM